MAAPGRDVVVAGGPRRRGLARLALAARVPLVPVYAFGLADVYHTSQRCRRPRAWLARHARVALPLFWGRWGTLLPRPGPLTVVVGAPVPLPPAEPVGASDEAADAYQARYVAALARLYARHAHTTGYPEGRALEVLDTAELRGVMR